MSVQKKFICGFASFVLFIGLVGFIIGFFARGSEKEKCKDDAKKRDFGITETPKTSEKQAFELISEQSIRDYQRNRNEFHFHGLNYSCTYAQKLMKEWNSSGLDTELKRYDVLLSYPTRPSKLLLVNQTARRVLYSSRLNTIHSWQVLDGLAYNTPPFSFYSSSGVSSGKLLYVNYGRENDFRYLRKENISCEGKILILRYGKIHEREKVANAQKWRAAGILLYLDPADNSTQQQFLTTSIWYPRVASSWVNGGNPFTTDLLVTAGTFMDDITLAQIPVQPIPRNEAVTLLSLLKNTAAPDQWQGGLVFKYCVEMAPHDSRNVSLNVSLARVKTPICNVVGTIKGEIESDRYVLLGSPHRFGAAVALKEVARVLMAFKKTKGWSPRRTIKICSWGAGNIGAVEWIEEYRRILESRAIAYLTIDKTKQDVPFGVLSHALLRNTALKAVKEVKFGGKWKNTSSLSGNIMSSCSPFVYGIGVPCVSLLHSLHNATSIHNTTDLVEPQVALVKALLQMTFDITDSLLIPFNVDQYANALHTWTEGLVAFYNGTLRKQNITLESFLKAAKEFQVAAKRFQDYLEAMNKENILLVRMINDRLIQLERAFIIEELSSSHVAIRRHVVLSPILVYVMSNFKFAGITNSIHRAQDGMKEREWDEVRRQISIATHAFRSAVSILQPPDV
ncbi:N-acetylated-alpha-linked acidic dipeptidase 2-like isoform X2 [Acropora palmata]|uniref:N-acetylated-alpha-linked acidic dipeptidase 2-like isoform X2 n=1 Tax=Acropora palmata TaxID=6131 RepID=UPI003DA16DCB